MTPSVLIRNRRDGTTLRALLNGPAPTPGPYGGWQEQDRPRRKPFLTWTTKPLIRQVIALCFDGYATDDSVEPWVTLLEAMATSDGVKRPPTVKVTGPIRHASKTWVIEDVGWGEARRNSRGVLVYQAFELALLEFEEGDVVKLRSARVFRGRHDRTDSRLFALVEPRSFATIGGRTVIRGENLLQVVARAMGDTKLWRTVADLNGIKDPRAPLKVNTKIRLP